MVSSASILNYRHVRFHLLPGSKAKARHLFGLAGAGRFVWNHFLGQHKEAYRLHKEDPEHHALPSVSFFSLSKAFTVLRNSGDFPWLQDSPSKSLGPP